MDDDLVLKGYHFTSFYKVDDEEWKECGYGGEALREDSDPEAEIKLDDASFEEVSDYLNKHCLSGVSSGETIFRHRRYFEAWNWPYDESRRRFYQGSFERFSYMRVFKEWPDCSLEWITKHATADQAIQYMKERGMNVCPLK